MIRREFEENRSRTPARPSDESGPRRSLWITWEVQRRTTEMARLLGVDLVRLVHKGPRWRRYPVLAAATIAELIKQRPAGLFVQNPSLILTALACLLKPLFRYSLVVDRHTNFMLTFPPCLKKRLFVALSDFTLRVTDLTIVTNDFLAALVRDSRGRAFVLQDAIPRLVPSSPAKRHQDLRQGFFVCTYAPDEPYNELFLAASRLEGQGRLLVSGRPPRDGFPDQVAAALDRSDVVKIMGFLPESEYVQAMHDSDFVVVLTRSEWCLVCGAYEAFSLDKPLILSDRRALREYFGPLPTYVDDTVDDLEVALRTAFAGELPQTSEITEFRVELEAQWNRRFESLKERLREIRAI